ncbi:MAG: PQQ-binding-like beta-propeller repeat protein [Planctomycetota bacterium]|nr:PQQ-binding-like beta-propeller repeat protein [Planctomycetota bacterium]MDA1179192.1 PQQ-binding-like beta-propeller repeat protein [Planctomycetota bacterium]
MGNICDRNWFVAFLSAGIFGIAGFGHADDWPQWRGPHRNAFSLEKGLMPSWPEGGPTLAWQFEGLGSGYSSVVVQDGRLFSLGKLNETDVVATAVDVLTHAVLWQRKIGSTSRNPCSTPTIDGANLYALDPDGRLVCLRCESGEVEWQKHLVEDLGGKPMSGRGFGESPLVDGPLLVCTPGGSDAVVVALDKLTGAVHWQSKMAEVGPAGKDGAGFSSIVVTEAAGVRQYVQLVGRGLIGIDVRNGQILWTYNPIANDIANIPTPVVDNEYVFAANGYSAGSVLLKIIAERTPSESESPVKIEEVYTLTASQFQNHHGGIVKVGDYLFGGHGNNNGLPTCLDFRSGSVLWKRRGPGVGSASVMYADGRLYLRYQNGVVALVEADHQGFQVRGTLEIPGAGGDSWAHPVVADGVLYLREQDRLWCYQIGASPGNDDKQEKVDDESASVRLQGAVERGHGTIEVFDPANWRSGGTAARAGRDTFYRSAISQVDVETNSKVLLIGLTNSHLKTDGTLTASLLELLQASPNRLFLSLAGTRFSDAGVAQLQDDLKHKVVGLNLELCHFVTDSAMDAVSQIDSLHVLSLAGTQISSVGVQQLIGLDRLALLDLEACDGIVDATCAAIGQLAGLHQLILKKSGFEKFRITDAGLRELTRLQQLEVLSLYGNEVTNEGMAMLGDFRSLKEVDLSLMPISDEGLEYLVQRTGLTRLSLVYSEGFSGPLITDRGVSSLVRIRGLRELDLTGARITDEGLESMASLEALQVLRLMRTPVSAQAVDRFRKLRPDCQTVQ